MKKTFKILLAKLRDAIDRAIEKDNPIIVMPYLYKIYNFLWSVNNAVNKRKKGAV